MPKSTQKKPQLHTTSCPLCGAKKSYQVIYPQNFKTSDLNVAVFSARRLPDKLHYQLVRCKNDGMVRSEPVLSLGDLSKLYRASKFTYHGEVKNLTKTYFKALQPILKLLEKNDTIVEVGCGNGFMLEALHKAGFKKTIGVEPSRDAIGHAKPQIQKQIINSIFKPSLLKKNSVAFLFIFQTLDHIPEPDKFLADCYKIIKPGGYLLSFHHNVDSLSAKTFGEKSPIIDVEHTQLFSLKTSRAIFEKVGLQVTSLYSPISYISLKHLAWLLPLPKNLKVKYLLSTNSFVERLSQTSLPISLGNVCVVGQKPV